MQPALSVDQKGQRGGQPQAGRGIDFSLFLEDRNGQCDGGEPDREKMLLQAVAFAHAHGFRAARSPQAAFALVSDSEDFKGAARSGASVLSFLVGRSISGLAKDIALYRRTLADCGHAGSGSVALVVPALVGEATTDIKRAARDAMSGCLRRHPSLLREAAWDFPLFLKVSEADGISLDQFLAGLRGERLDAMVEFAADRYVASHGLFGSQSECLALVERLRQAGVDELACQIDFACPLSVALEHLPQLDELRRAALAVPRQVESADQAFSRDFEQSSGAPVRTDAQNKLAALWKKLLDVPEVEPGDNFFDLGGHSLLAARAVSEIERSFGVRVSVKTLMVSSFDQLASELDRHAAAL